MSAWIVGEWTAARVRERAGKHPLRPGVPAVWLAGEVIEHSSLRFRCALIGDSVDASVAFLHARDMVRQ